MTDRTDEWIAQIVHELRTPLTPIRGFLHTLQRRDDQLTPEDRQKIYDVLLREEQRLEELVNRLLLATTIDQRGLAVASEIVSWPTIVSEQTDLYRRSDPSRTITVTMDPLVADVAADPTLATGILANLLSNALKYSPEGTTIVVEATLDEDRVVTTVSDEGPGVAPEDRERIFDKFTRLGDPSTSSHRGVGLGLFIARRSLEAMGGEIWCDEGPAGGARFGFSLPVHT